MQAALAGAADSARRVVVFDREGLGRAFVAADYLSDKGIEVVFLTGLSSIGPLLDGHMRDEMIQQLSARSVTFEAGIAPVAWLAAGQLLVRDIPTAAERVISNVDMVVATIGSSSIQELAHELRGQVPELHVIGDANQPQTMEHATYQGALIGRRL